MKHFACWEVVNVRETVKDDANRDTPAVFNAVHRPMHVLRKEIRLGTRDRGTPVKEEDVLNALIRDDPSDDRIVPIVGESGTGKSHLIKWLAMNIENRDDRHVVYIQKRGTNLKEVVRTILDGLDRPEIRNRERFAELRADVEAAADMDPTTARPRLLYALAQEVAERGTENSADDDERADREELADQLPELLRDREFRDQLLADGGVLARSVAKAVGQAPEEEEPAAFEDLRLEVRDIKDLGRTAREIQLTLTGDAGQHDLAVTMLNERLNDAVGSLLGVGRRQIFEIMIEIREALLDAGMTLVLLVEDFALLRGIETQLLDAMVAEADPGGIRTLCPMRTALAVTSGYFEGKQTALTRIDFRGGYLYSLDTDLEGEHGVSREEIYKFVATYLNAARLGAAPLQAAFERSDGARTNQSWVPNPCPKCTYVTECHDSFGRADGYGLYPFNRRALDRILNARFPHFDPRLLLKIVERTLREERENIVAGQFPNPEWAEPYDAQQVEGRAELDYVPAAVTERFRELDPPTTDRRRTLMNFWGGAPRAAVNLHPTIHDAFDLRSLPDLPVLDDVDVKPDGDGRGNSGGGGTTGSDGGGGGSGEGGTTGGGGDSEVKTGIAHALDLWGNGRGLEQGPANDVRKALAAVVLGAREWPALGVDLGRLPRLLSPPAFSLEDATGEGGAATRKLATLEATPENALLLQGLMEFTGRGTWPGPRAHERLAQFANLVDTWADEAVEELRAQPSPLATQLLLIANAALGLAGPDHPRETLIDSLFAEAPSPQSGRWGDFQRRLLTSAAAHRDELQKLVKDPHEVRQGSDKDDNVIAIDVAPLVAALRALEERGWTVPDAGEVSDAEPSVIRRYAKLLHEELRTHVTERLRDLASRRARALELLGDVRDPAKVAGAVNDARFAATDAEAARQVTGADRDRLEAVFRGSDLGALDRLAALNGHESLPWRDQLALVVKAEHERLAPIDEYLSWAEQFLDGSLAFLKKELTGHTDGGGGDEVAATTFELIETLDSLAVRLEQARR